MRLLRQALTAFGGVAVIAAIIVLATPKVARAVAALVQIANTSATAIPTSDLGPSNEPFWVPLCSSTIPGSTCSESTNFTVPSMTVDGKTVKRLVIEQVTGTCVGTAPVDEFYLGATPLDPTSENLPNGSGETALYIQQIGPTFGSSPILEQVYSQLIRDYGDPGQNIALFHIGDGENSCSAEIIGYLTTV